MIIKIKSGTYSTIDGLIIDVEVDITKGIPSLNIVGLPDASVKEARERVRSAIINSDFQYPMGRITVSLAPADIKKNGSLLDLPIAIGILMCTNQIPYRDLDNYIITGELSLSGDIKGINGVLPIVLLGKEMGIENYIFPIDNVNECYYDSTVNYYPFKNLKEVVSFIMYKDVLPYIREEDSLVKEKRLDFSNIIGQDFAKRGLLIGACGNHNMLLFGSTGCGKTMLANALPSILPELDLEEELELAKIYSVMGLIPKNGRIQRPFRNPHHTTTTSALVGGGKKVRVGEVTLAHNGVLFLDEILEFNRSSLESLREPLEEGKVTITRVQGSYELPASFLLIASHNLCPCGNSQGVVSAYGGDNCTCSENERNRYLNKLSKAMKDRIDIFNFVPKIKYEEIKNREQGMTSNEMKEIVLKVREIQKVRYKDTKYKYNSEIKGRDIFELCRVSKSVEEILSCYFNKVSPSLRAYGKVIKVARTIADINNNKDISDSDVIEAISYRKDSNGNII